jgi:hypothetical protein
MRPKDDQIDFPLFDDSGHRFLNIALADDHFVVDAAELLIQAPGLLFDPLVESFAIAAQASGAETT